jgi:hypothetical protein
MPLPPANGPNTARAFEFQQDAWHLPPLAFIHVDPPNRFTSPMKRLIVFSLLFNIAVLLPVCAGLMTDARWSQLSYGEATPARGILLSVYLSLLIASFLLLASRNPRSVAALLAVQILYKMTTPFTVGTLHHPVVISNLGIAVFHTITLLSIWRAIGNPFRK